MNIIYRFLAISIGLFLFSCGQMNKEKPGEKPPVARDTLPKSPTESSHNEYTLVDISPMDMTYFPVDYPKLKMTKVMAGPPLARVIYSRPHLQGRQLFGEVLKYEEPWRLGANEATELELFKPATIQEQKVPAGRYVLYCIPHKDKWTIVLNSNIDTWGLHPDATKDIARFDVPTTTTANHIEYFTMVFEKKGEAAELLMAWDGIEARLGFRF